MAEILGRVEGMGEEERENEGGEREGEIDRSGRGEGREKAR